MPVGDACEVESFFYGDFRVRERAEGLLDGVVIGKVLPEECLASGSRPAWGGIEVYWRAQHLLNYGVLFSAWDVFNDVSHSVGLRLV